MVVIDNTGITLDSDTIKCIGESFTQLVHLRYKLLIFIIMQHALTTCHSTKFYCLHQALP